VTLTAGGFAPPRTVALRGKGGNRGRRDNEVSPPSPRDMDSGLDDADTAGIDTTVATEPPALTRPWVSAPRRQPSPRTRTGVGRRTTVRRATPAALEWRDARLPLFGRIWATAWLPSILLAGCLVALMYLLQTSGIATAGYDIQRLQSERDDWQLRNEQLQLELAKRRSLTWIEAEATGRLGMVRAEPTALTYVTATR
jgi:hypothetical protein